MKSRKIAGRTINGRFHHFLGNTFSPRELGIELAYYRDNGYKSVHYRREAWPGAPMGKAYCIYGLKS